MKIDRLTITGMNMMDILTDKEVYVIHESAFLHPDECYMEPIRECKIEDLLSDNVVVIKITKN